MRKFVVCVLLSACGQSDPAVTAAKSAPEVKRQSLAEIDAPKHDMTAMAAAEQEFQIAKAQGTMTAKLGGVATAFTFLPPGSNASIVDENKGIARVIIGGAPDDRGQPLLRISLDGVRLDSLTLPASFTLSDPNRSDTTPHARIDYQIDERRAWRAQPGGQVNIESYEGGRVRGSFSAVLMPSSGAAGQPVEVTDGRFDVVLRQGGAQAKVAPSSRPAATP